MVTGHDLSKCVLLLVSQLQPIEVQGFILRAFVSTALCLFTQCWKAASSTLASLEANTVGAALCAQFLPQAHLDVLLQITDLVGLLCARLPLNSFEKAGVVLDCQ